MKKIIQRKEIYNQNGNALMIVMVLFIVISLSIASGLVAPVLRSNRIATNNIKSKQSYFLAESGAEDAFYRIKNNKQISSNEVINIGNDFVTTNIISVGNNQKEIIADGDSGNRKRNINMKIITGTGIVFRYGTQAGQGGMYLGGGNTGLYGTLYSNGNIIGNNGSFITGEVYAANSPALNADQTNDTPVTPSNNMTFGTTNATQDIAQSFKLSNGGLVNKVEFYIKKVGNPGNVTVRITTNNNGAPSTTTIASGTLNASLVTTNYGWTNVTFSSQYLAANTTYWIGIDYNTNASNYYVLAGNQNGYANGEAKIGAYSSTWGNTTPVDLDAYFKIYLGGFTSVINNINIGQNGLGDAHAHEIKNSNIAGTAYCKVYSNNNKTCNTSQEDPIPEPLPVSDANIMQWKDDADDTIINGNVTISSPTTLTASKIVGNLTINNTLTIAGTVWVTGNITTANNVQIKIDPVYNTSSAVIIADGYINLAGGVQVLGNGQLSSYLMFLSTAICDGDTNGNPCGGGVDAITIRNNSSIVIANAQNGTVYFGNNAEVKEVVGNKIKLSNNATITYGTGIFNPNFMSGPSGGWNISSWLETQ